MNKDKVSFKSVQENFQINSRVFFLPQRTLRIHKGHEDLKRELEFTNNIGRCRKRGERQSICNDFVRGLVYCFFKKYNYLM